MLPRPAPLLLAALCVTVPLAARAEVYKWVDERGVVNYGDAPPQRAKAVRPLDSGAGTLSVVPGIPREELERLRERDAERRLRQLEAEVDELRAREAERAAAPVAEPPEPTVYRYPVYAYPVHGRAGRWHRRPDARWPGRPAHPIAAPWPGQRPLHPGERRPFVNELPPVSLKR